MASNPASRSPAAGNASPALVVMAKPAIPGRVKTRLIPHYTPRQAAEIHAAMLQCVLSRAGELAEQVDSCRLVVAMAELDDKQAELIDIDIPRDWEVIDQGRGDLGERLIHVWQALGGGPALFLGIDSPDFPIDALSKIVSDGFLCDAAIGPVDDGGYWVIAACQLFPQLLTRIDWGTERVYHQTLIAAEQAGLEVQPLPGWYDVDTPDDVKALGQRLESAAQKPLIELRKRLIRICKD